MNSIQQRLIGGFIAAVLSIAIFFQGILLILWVLGMTPNFPWSFRPGPFGVVPSLINQMFWGGVWGVLFAAVWERIPVSNALVKGLIAGIVGPAVIGVWILVPLIKGGAMFSGFVPMRMLITLIIHAA